MSETIASEPDPATVFIGGHDDTVGVAPDRGGASRGVHRNAVGRGVVPGTHIGRYIVIEELGRGGMGVVVRAYDPKLQREVALKSVRTDRLHDDGQARLVREARAMARLRHPNVVAVYDVELELQVEGRRPGVVVVMEYVPGTTMRRWLDDGPRPWSQTLDALVAAGRGLAAAHAEGLLHRDFKLDNVLVEDGAVVRVRVTDFGLARADGSRSSASLDPVRDPSRELTGSEDTLADELTAHGTVMGTPIYMPPEQMVGDELDPRADQYAYCIAAWKALTDRWPFMATDREELLRAKQAHAPRWPREVTVPSHVAAALRRGLAPNAVDRWPDMGALLAELSRNPARRRGWVAAGALVVATAGGLWGWQHMQRAAAEAGCEREAALITEVYAEPRAVAIGTAFEGTGVTYATDTWARTRGELDAYAARWSEARTEVCRRAELEASMTPDDVLAARECLDELSTGLGALLSELDEPTPAAVEGTALAVAMLPPVMRCTDPAWLRLRPAPPRDPARRDEVRRLRREILGATAAGVAGRYEASVERLAALRPEAEALEWPPLAAEAQLAHGEALTRLARYEDAREAYETAFYGAGAAGHDELALRAAAPLVLVVGDRLGHADEGLQWHRMAQMLIERLDLEDDLMVAGVLGSVGAIHLSRAAYDEARAVFEPALSILEAKLGPTDPLVASALDSLGLTLSEAGDPEGAIELHRRSLAIREERLGPEHPEVGTTLNHLALALIHQGKRDEARAAFERALRIYEQALDPAHVDIAMVLVNLGRVYTEQGEHDLAIDVRKRAIAIYYESLPPGHPNHAIAQMSLGTAQQARGDLDEALASYQRANAALEAGQGPDHPNLGMGLVNMAVIQQQLGRDDEGLESLTRALAIFETKLGPTHPLVATTLYNLALARFRRGAMALAREHAERSLAIRETTAPEHPQALAARVILGRIALTLGEPREALTRCTPVLDVDPGTNAGDQDTRHARATARFCVEAAQVELGGEVESARASVQKAREILASLGDDAAADVAAIDAWLSEHTAPEGG